MIYDIGVNMTAVREIVDSSSLAGIFDLPHFLRNRKVEVTVSPIEEETEKLSQFTMEQIKEWSQSPKVQAIVGVLKDAGLPPDITMKDIRQMRLDNIVTRNKKDFASAALPVVSPDELLALMNKSKT